MTGQIEVVEFENTSTKVEVTKWYTISGAPMIQGKTWRLLPSAARFVFRDGDVAEMSVNARVVTKTGVVSDRWQQLPDIYIWNGNTWPHWLRDLYKLAINDFQADKMAQLVLA